MITFKDIGFRPIDREDLEIIRKMHNDPQILLFLGDVTLVNSTQQLAWWEHMSAGRKNLQFCICYQRPDKVIGVWRLQNFDQNNRVCEVGVDIFPAYQHKSYGAKAYRMILCYLFEHYNLHMVYLRAAAFNTKAISLYEKIGFKETGRITESIYRHGKYWDNILMCMTKDEYFLHIAKDR